MPELPLVGVTAVIAGMAAFNRDAALVESSMLRMGRAADQLEAQTVGAFGGADSAFGSMAAAVATGATIVTGALLLGAAASVKFAADFQQGMALTQALSGATDTEIAGLTGTIEELARKGTVGMAALSEGARDLARSGVTIPEVMGGALKAVQELTIASGGEISLDSAAKLVANSMHAFGLSANDATRITTAASVVAQNSSATFTDFGTAVAIAGAQFKSVGFTIEDLSIAETLLTNKGVNASTAATALRGVIQRLERPSKDAAAVMKEYGIHLFDAAGKAVTFKDLLIQLNTAFSDEAVAAGKLTEKQRDVAVSTIGLQRTGAAFLVLANEGTAGFDRLNESFGRLKAADLVEIVLKPLNAQAEIAWNNIEVLGRAFGSSFLPALQESTAGMVFFLQSLKTADAVKFGATLVVAIKDLGSAIASSLAVIKGFADAFGLTSIAGEVLKTTAVGLGIVILAVLVPPILAGVAALGLFLAQIAFVGTAVVGLSGFIADGSTAIANWAQDMGIGGALVADAFRVVSDLALSVGSLLRGDFASSATFAGLAIHEFGDGLVQDGGKALDEIGKKLDDTGAAWAPWAAQAGPAGVVVSHAIVGAHQAVEGLAFLLQGNFPAAAADGQLALASFGDAMQPIVDAINGALKVALEWLGDVAWPAVQRAAKVATDVFNNEVVPAFRQVADWARTVVIPALQELIDKINNDLKAAVDWATTTGLPNLGTAAHDAALQVNDLALTLESAARVADHRGAYESLQHGIEQLAEAVTRLMALPFVVSLEITGGAVQRIATVFGTGAEAAYSLGVGFDSLAKVFDFVATKFNEFSKLFQHVVAEIGATLVDIVAANAKFAGDAVDAFGRAFLAVQDFSIKVPGTLTALAANIGPIAEAIGFAIVSGISNALVRGVAQVAANAAALASAALQAARDAVHAQSPSRDFEVLGEDMAEGVNIGLLRNIPRAKDAAKTYGDSILQEMATFTDGIEKASRDISSKLDDIVIKAATSTASLIDKANHDIQVSIDQTQAALDRLGGSEADPSSFVAREAALRDSINQEKLLHNQARQDADLESRHAKDLALADAAFKKNLDLENSKFQQNLLADKNQKEIDADNLSHKNALVNLGIRHTDDIAAANQRFEDAKKGALDQRAIDIAEREFIRQEDAKITAFKQQQLIQERDTKIATIQQTEQTSIATVQSSADKQRAVLLKSYEERIADLQSALLNKIPPLTEDQGALLQQFLDNVQVQTDQTTQAIADAMGQTVTTAVTDIGNAATLTLGAGGIIPRAAAVTTTAFNVATDSAGGLRGTSSTGLLGATDAATQISFVLQQLDDKMPHLVAGIHDLVDAINMLHDKDITITTHHVDVGGGGGGATAPPSGGASGPGGVFDTARQAIADSGGDGRILVMGEGGIVPGPLGVPMFAIVHGGEFVASVNSEIGKWARQMVGSQPTSSKEYNYNVNARYETTQSPASVSMDMRALVALSRGS